MLSVSLLFTLSFLVYESKEKRICLTKERKKSTYLGYNSHITSSQCCIPEECQAHGLNDLAIGVGFCGKGRDFFHPRSVHTPALGPTQSPL
jgi:hypothetical protein